MSKESNFITPKEIKEKQKFLNSVGTVLKKKYRGIDDVIDKIMGYMQTWYIFDEVLYKPVIINLWSLTGNGKTGLVRDLVKLMDMIHKFCEIDISKTQEPVGNSPYSRGFYSHGTNNSVSSKIFNVFRSTDDKGIVLIDEIQKIKLNRINNNFDDVWHLLSDGRLGNGVSILNSYDEMIASIDREFDMYNRRMQEEAYSKLYNVQGASQYDGNDPFSRRMPNINPYMTPLHGLITARYLITASEERGIFENATTIEDFNPFFDFHLFNNTIQNNQNNPYNNILFKEEIRKKFEEGKITTKDIIELPNFVYLTSLREFVSQMKNKVVASMKRTDSKDPLVFSKLLIFVAGNVDGLYEDCNNIDISAEELHEKTLRLTDGDLKNELMKSFTPEEVSRFGSNHVVYPSLNTDAFKSIIGDHLAIIEKDLLDKTGIVIKLRTPLYITMLYNTCVVPSQGVRPLISKIQSEVGNHIPKLIEYAIENGREEVSVNELKAIMSNAPISKSISSTPPRQRRQKAV